MGVEEDQLGKHIRTLLKDLATGAITAGVPMLMKALMMGTPPDPEYDPMANRYYI